MPQYKLYVIYSIKNESNLPHNVPSGIFLCDGIRYVSIPDNWLGLIKRIESISFASSQYYHGGTPVSGSPGIRAQTGMLIHPHPAYWPRSLNSPPWIFCMQSSLWSCESFMRGKSGESKLLYTKAYDWESRGCWKILHISNFPAGSSSELWDPHILHFLSLECLNCWPQSYSTGICFHI